MAARDGSTIEQSIEIDLSSSEDEGGPPQPPPVTVAAKDGATQRRPSSSGSTSTIPTVDASLMLFPEEATVEEIFGEPDSDLEQARAAQAAAASGAAGAAAGAAACAVTQAAAAPAADAHAVAGEPALPDNISEDALVERLQTLLRSHGQQFLVESRFSLKKVREELESSLQLQPGALRRHKARLARLLERDEVHQALVDNARSRVAAQDIHRKAGFPTESCIEQVQKCFEIPEPRLQFEMYGKTKDIPRDALHFAETDGDGYTALYRVQNAAYADLRKPTSTAGIADARVPKPIPE